MLEKYFSKKSSQMFSFIFMLLFYATMLGQQKLNSSDKFNLPPGAVFNPKTYSQIDYSEKLYSSNNKESLNKNYLHEFSPKEIEEMKVKYPKDYVYYNDALNYFNSLSDKVKKTFTVDELWYIYIFDQKLKNTLTTVN